MGPIGRTERERAVQTLADFEGDGLGHHLDNADADLLRAMVRVSAERHAGAVDALKEAANALDLAAASLLRFGHGVTAESVRKDAARAHAAGGAGK